MPHMVDTKPKTEEKFLEDQELIISTGTYPCIFKIEDDFYDYTPLKLGSTEVHDKTGHYPFAVDSSDPTQFYYFNWCEYLSELDDATCSGHYYAAGKSADEEGCVAYSGDSPRDDISAKKISGNVEYANKTTSDLDGIALKYNHGAKCPSTGEDYSFTINVYCDANIDDADFNGRAYGDACSPYINVISKYGCPTLSVSELWNYIAKYEDYFGVFAIVAGIMLCFFGHWLIKPSICFAGFLSTIVLSCLIFYAVYLDNTSDLADFWYFLGGGALVGILVGLVLAWAVKVGAAILAGWGGFCLALILNETLFYRAGVEWLFWVSIVVIVIACAVAAFFIFDMAVILATVTLGSYCLVRGVAAYAGHYYNEATMAKMLSEGLLDDIDPWYWAYVGGFVLMMLLGSCIQLKRLKRIKQKEEE